MHKVIWRVSEVSNIRNPPPPDGVVEVSRDEICELYNKVGSLPRFLLLFLIFAIYPSYLS